MGKFANADMKGNPDIVYAAAMRNIGSLRHASAELRSSYEFMLRILENCGTASHSQKETALDYALDEIRFRPELQVLAMQRQQEALARQSAEAERRRSNQGAPLQLPHRMDQK